MSPKHVFPLLALASAFVGGSIWFALPQAIYSPPLRYEVERLGDRVTYHAVGRKLETCRPIAPYVAELHRNRSWLWSVVVARAAIHRPDGSVARRQTPRGILADTEFETSGLWFRVRPSLLDRADAFVVLVPCETASGDEVVARFGPMPVPADRQVERRP